MLNIDYTKKPKRPFGVSLAIFTSVLLFVLLPIAEVAFFVSLNNVMIFDEVGRSGMNVIGIDNMREPIIFQVTLAIVFFILAIAAWMGRPTYIRLVFSGAIGIIGLVTIGMQILPRLAAAPTIMDASREVNQPILIFYLVMTIIITLYSVWYMNRWAARAYYRGHYLPEDIEEMKRIEKELMSSAEA